MAEEQNSLWPSLWKYIDPKEKHLTHREGVIFNQIVSITKLNQLKENILEESRVGRNDLNLCESKSIHFCLPQVYHFPEFVTWCVQNYSSTRRVALLEDESKVIFPVNIESIMEMLKLSINEIQDQVPLNEENMIMLFHQLSLESNFE